MSRRKSVGTVYVLLTLMVCVAMATIGYSIYQRETAWRALEEKMLRHTESLDEALQGATRRIDRRIKEGEERQRVLDQLDDHQQ